MCVKKLRILNPAYDPHDVLSSEYIEVNCGHCWQCQLERSNGFSFRVLNEVLKDGVYPFFVTLTYSPDYRPYLTYKYFDKDDIVHFKSVSCWNRAHVQRFHKRVRRSLEYYFGVPSSAFKYLCSCERGSSEEYVDDRGRLRLAQQCPHYHLMYLLSPSSDILPVKPLPLAFISYCKFKTLAPDFRNFFKWLLSDKWFYGHVDNIEYCRDVVSATTYITKYLTKNISENLFGIDPQNIVSFYDKEFEESSFHFAKRYYKMDFSGFSSVSVDVGRCSGIHGCPKPIVLSSLVPRSFGSINLGLSFLDNLSEDELFSYFSGQKKVCLPHAHSQSSINLPDYYYRRVCKSLKRLHYNRVYTKKAVVDGSVKTVSFKTEKLVHFMPTWNNVKGFHYVDNLKTYTSSITSDFGRIVKRYRVAHQVSTLLVSVKDILRKRIYYQSILNKFHAFPDNVRSAVTDVTQNMFDSFFSVSSKGLFGKLLKLRFTSFSKFSSEQTILFHLVNFVKLCNFTLSHLRHIAFENSYQRKLCKVAIDNPDLFTTHYF